MRTINDLSQLEDPNVTVVRDHGGQGVIWRRAYGQWQGHDGPGYVSRTSQELLRRGDLVDVSGEVQ